MTAIEPVFRSWEIVARIIMRANGARIIDREPAHVPDPGREVVAINHATLDEAERARKLTEPT